MMAAMVIGLVQIMMGIEALQAVVNVIKKNNWLSVDPTDYWYG